MFVSLIHYNKSTKAHNDLPVCVRICLLSRLGRSNAFPHTSHGNSARSPRVGLAFGDDLGIVMVESNKSPVLLAADDEDDVNDSPETDLCSSSPPDGGDIGNSTRDSNDIDKSNGDSGLLFFALFWRYKAFLFEKHFFRHQSVLGYG